MQALILPASRGWRWIAEGFAIYGKRRLLLPVLVMLNLFIMLVLGTVPFVGRAVATVLIPTFSVGLMNACRLIEQDVRFPVGILFSGFRRNARALISLGFAYVLFNLSILALTALLDGGAIMDYLLNGTVAESAAQSGESSLLIGLLAAFPFLQLAMAYWFAPVLVAWRDLPVAKALFFSYVACIRNWRAFLTYFSAVLILTLLFMSLAVGVLTPLFPPSGEAVVAIVSAMVIVLFAPMMYGSFYAAYRDIFVTIETNV